MALLLLFVAWALAGTMTVEVLDVGQGDAILVRSPAGKSVLIDAGDGGAPVVAMLARRGIDGLDLLVASHPHADHIGGLDEVLEAVPAKFFLDNGLPHTTMVYTRVMKLVEERGLGYRTARAGQSYSLDDGIRIEVLFPTGSPLRNTRSDLNSNSVALRLTHGADCFLFPGDAEDETEQALMRAGIEPCGVLKVAHHGSEHSTSAAWLRAVKPEIALISVGANNRYGHPDPAALDRLDAAGARVWRTDRGGTIRLESSGEGVVVSQSPEPEVLASESAGLAARPASRASAPALAPGEKIDLNAAGEADLDRLPGIGPARAAAVLAWRAENGPFRTADDLLRVPGIGPATLDKLRPFVVVGTEPTAAEGEVDDRD